MEGAFGTTINLETTVSEKSLVNVSSKIERKLLNDLPVRTVSYK